MKNITEIIYPCDAEDCDQFIIAVGKTCDEIRSIQKNGEMATVTWFQVVKGGRITMELPKRICIVHGNDEVEPNPGGSI